MFQRITKKKRVTLFSTSSFLLFCNHDKYYCSYKGATMLDMVIVFLILAIIAGALGFSGVEIISVQIAQVLFFIFLVLFVLSLIARVFGANVRQ